jgi:hypothetical protein
MYAKGAARPLFRWPYRGYTEYRGMPYRVSTLVGMDGYCGQRNRIPTTLLEGGPYQFPGVVCPAASSSRALRYIRSFWSRIR